MFVDLIGRHLLEHPGSYAELMSFYLRKRGPPRLDPPPDLLDSAFMCSGPSLCEGLPAMEVRTLLIRRLPLHRVGC